MPIASTSLAPDPVPQPRQLTLFCWILGVSHSSFPVDIEDNGTVDDLKTAIVKKNPRALANVDADDLTLWKVIDSCLHFH